MLNEDKIIEKLVEHEEILKNLVTKGEFQEFKDKVLTAQDEILAIVRRLDQERIFTASWISRIEKEVEKNKEEITAIKQLLKV